MRNVASPATVKDAKTKGNRKVKRAKVGLLSLMLPQ